MNAAGVGSSRAQHNSNNLCTRARRRLLDLNAGSGESAELQHKTVVVNGTVATTMSVTILVDDEDDDVVVSSPRSFAQAKSNGRSAPRRTTHQSVLPEDPLELRLGPGGSGSGQFRIRALSEAQPCSEHHSHTLKPVFDLTTPGEDCILLPENPRRRKRREPVLAEQPKEKELRLSCAICMDTMKKETSTVCGHIFCQACIHSAILAQTKCPTCRKKLSNKDVHRVYIQSSTE